MSATRERGKKKAGRKAASELERTLGRATRRLLSLQRPDGWWVGELESNVTMTAQHLLLLEFLRLRDEDTTRRCVNELLARQRPDGLWSIYWEGEPDLAATLESYAALRLAGFSADDERLAAARRFCEERGGIGGARVFTRIWLALFGLWPWEEIPQLPPELVLMPPSGPLSVYDFACWARQTVVPLTVVLHYRPVRQLPAERACHELNLGPMSRKPTLGLLSGALREEFSEETLFWFFGGAVASLIGALCAFLYEMLVASSSLLKQIAEDKRAKRGRGIVRKPRLPESIAPSRRA